MEYTDTVMKQFLMLIISCIVLIHAVYPQESEPAIQEYSPWTFFGGLNYIYNADGAGTTSTVGTQGLDSAPSPLVGFLGFEYRHPLPKQGVFFAPSASFFLLTYLWANDRALPAEIENRTAFVPAILLDASFLYTIQKDRFLFSFGGGPGIMLRYAFLESGVSEDETSYSGDVPAGEQVDNINSYLWSSLRWFYPMAQGNIRYQLPNGWGAGASLRLGLPIFNIWSDPDTSLADSLMILFALTITAPSGEKIHIEDPFQSTDIDQPEPDTAP